jgi:hypothetical protein
MAATVLIVGLGLWWTAEPPFSPSAAPKTRGDVPDEGTDTLPDLFVDIPIEMVPAPDSPAGFRVGRRHPGAGMVWLDAPPGLDGPAARSALARLVSDDVSARSRRLPGRIRLVWKADGSLPHGWVHEVSAALNRTGLPVADALSLDEGGDDAPALATVFGVGPKPLGEDETGETPLHITAVVRRPWLPEPAITRGEFRRSVAGVLDPGLEWAKRHGRGRPTALLILFDPEVRHSAVQEVMSAAAGRGLRVSSFTPWTYRPEGLPSPPPGTLWVDIVRVGEDRFACVLVCDEPDGPAASVEMGAGPTVPDETAVTLEAADRADLAHKLRGRRRRTFLPPPAVIRPDSSLRDADIALVFGAVLAAGFPEVHFSLGPADGEP